MVKIPGLKKGREKFSCNQDSNTGMLHCESFRQLEDGTTTQLAQADFTFDASCQPVPTNLVEFEEGELQKLDKKAMPLLKAKCGGRVPKDF